MLIRKGRTALVSGCVPSAARAVVLAVMLMLLGVFRDCACAELATPNCVAASAIAAFRRKTRRLKASIAGIVNCSWFESRRQRIVCVVEATQIQLEACRSTDASN